MRSTYGARWRAIVVGGREWCGKTLADELGQSSVQVDVTRAADIQRMLDLAFQRWGRIDVLFNNAGIAEVRPLFELTEDEWDRMLAVNLRAVFFVSPRFRVLNCVES